MSDQPQMRLLAASLIGVGLLTSNRRMVRGGGRVLIAHEVATLVKNILKRRIDRTRPRSAAPNVNRKIRGGNNPSEEETSFPSGHSSGATAGAVAWAGEYPEHRTAVLGGAAVVSAAQVPRLAHYPTDVAAGVAIGTLSAAVTNWAFEALFGREGEHSSDPLPAGTMAEVTVRELQWRDAELGEIALPKRQLKIAGGFGSGLTSRGGELWAICDRGPNLKISDAKKLYGWRAPAGYPKGSGAKMMPRIDVGPTLARLIVSKDRVEVEHTTRLKVLDGRLVSGLPIPESGHADCEPVLDLEGKRIAPDPTGMDTEGLALLADGSFWISEEYGPSLARVSANGKVFTRFVPEGVQLLNAGCEVLPVLPAVAIKRHLNRGFEAIASTPCGNRLYVAFQSPLAHPSVEQHEKSRHVRLWQLDQSGTVTKQYLYRLDEPDSFRRDTEEKTVERGDLKVCEIVATHEDQLLVLERASETSKIYRVHIRDEFSLPAEHLKIETRPTIEELSCAGSELEELRKELLFSSDEFREVSSDIEGMAVLDAKSLLIVSDNDFGCEGKATRFYRLSFARPLL